MSKTPIRFGRLLRGVAGLAAWAGLVVPALAQAPQVALVEAGQKPDLVVLHTGDVIGYLKPCG